MTGKLRTLTLIAALGLGASACASDYGYGGLSVGYGSGYYGQGYYGGDYYGDGYYGSSYGYAPGSYYGWYGGYYYPGSGYYVYDRYQRPHRWSDSQRRYWEGRRDRNWRDDRGGNRQNWDGFRRDGAQGDRNWRQDRSGDRQRWSGNQGTREGYRGQARPQQRGIAPTQRQQPRTFTPSPNQQQRGYTARQRPELSQGRRGRQEN